MNIFERPSPEHASPGRSADEVEGLLREFYRAEMPDPWPQLRPPTEQPSSAAPAPWRGWGLLRSRLALAASVALLVAGHLALAHSVPGDTGHDRGKRRDVIAKSPRNAHQGPKSTPAHPADSPARAR
jgi:hypothetical protein